MRRFRYYARFPGERWTEVSELEYLRLKVMAYESDPLVVGILFAEFEYRLECV